MSISENTAKINQLITKINDLPSAAPTVRRVESSFVVTYDEEGATYVDCGFKPDVVLFTGFNYQDGYRVCNVQLACVLSELPTDSTEHWVECYSWALKENNDRWYGIYMQPTDTGFKLMDFMYLDESAGEYVHPEGEVYNYVAIKYT